ncbi:MAG: ABC transporter ATP-binding protein [Opitutaceae bacterium]
MVAAPRSTSSTASATPAVSIAGVRKVFRSVEGREVVALEGADLVVAPGEILSLVGPSGCGKSTLLRIVSGLETANAGATLVDGAQVTGPGTQVGFVFQDPNLFPWLTVRENIAFGPNLHAGRKAWAAETDDLLRRIGLAGFANALPHHLSGGMAQRAALARALVNRPPVLLLDEPLGALDAFTRMAMQDELRALVRQRGTTVLLVTHDIDEALYLSDRIAIFSPRPGRVQETISLGANFPRVRNAPEFIAQRLRILETLHFAPEHSGSADPLEHI